MSEVLKYPTELVLSISSLPETIDQSELNEKGLFVMRGLDVQIARQLIEYSTQAHIIKNCEGDSTRRFANIDSIITWHLKGRLPMPLVKRLGNGTLKLAGFGWMGPEKLKDNEPSIPGATTTFAIRIYDGFTGDHNSLPYTKTMLEVHRELYDNEGVWLAGWGDNINALSTYKKAGFETVGEITELRHGEEVSRVYMALRRPDSETRV